MTRTHIRTPADLGAIIRDRRKQLDLDQATLAKRIGASRRWVIGIERGRARAVFFSSSRRHTRFDCHWSSDVCSSDLSPASEVQIPRNPPRKESGDRLKQKGPFPDSEEGVERVTRERYIVVGTPVQMGASIIRACSAVLDRYHDAPSGVYG